MEKNKSKYKMVGVLPIRIVLRKKTLCLQSQTAQFTIKITIKKKLTTKEVDISKKSEANQALVVLTQTLQKDGTQYSEERADRHCRPHTLFSRKDSRSRHIALPQQNNLAQ